MLWVVLISDNVPQAAQTMHINSYVRLIIGCLQYFTNIYSYIKLGSIIANMNVWNPWKYVIDMSNATLWVWWIWIRIYYVLCSKHIYCTFAVCSGPPVVRDGPLGAPALVRPPYFLPGSWAGVWIVNLRVWILACIAKPLLKILKYSNDE